MKRSFSFVVVAALFFWIQFFVNCSNPLEDIGAGNQSPADPGNGCDTIFDIDTVFSTDTVTVVDTIIIAGPDSGWSRLLCSRIASNQPEIVWMFRNEAGNYLLEFTALPESEHPPQLLSVDIDGETIPWTPAENRELVTEATLGQNATIHIRPGKPPSLGHTVYICLTIRRP